MMCVANTINVVLNFEQSYLFQSQNIFINLFCPPLFETTNSCCEKSYNFNFYIGLQVQKLLKFVDKLHSKFENSGHTKVCHSLTVYSFHRKWYISMLLKLGTPTYCWLKVYPEDLVLTN